MHLSATHINYYIVCKRKLWLFSHGIRMEHTSDTVYDGKLLHETSYLQRAEKHNEIDVSAVYDNIELSGKIDFYDAKNKIIHETKRSDKVEAAHEWQVKYYIWLLELNGIENASAVLEYPKLRKTDEIILTEPDRSFLKGTILKIMELISSDRCPPTINAKICRSCSYFEFCYIDES